MIRNKDNLKNAAIFVMAIALTWPLASEAQAQNRRAFVATMEQSDLFVNRQDTAQVAEFWSWTDSQGEFIVVEPEGLNDLVLIPVDTNNHLQLVEVREFYPNGTSKTFQYLRQVRGSYRAFELRDKLPPLPDVSRNADDHAAIYRKDRDKPNRRPDGLPVRQNQGGRR